jgi:hydrogenase nickel incorporation protein HypA/HybF
VHESSLAKQIVELCLARAQGARVRRVHGWVAETEILSREAIELNFAAQARGTLAEGAQLVIELVHVRARCRGCEQVYRPEHHLLLCPACGATDGEQFGRTGMKIESIEVDASEHE